MAGWEEDMLRRADLVFVAAGAVLAGVGADRLRVARGLAVDHVASGLGGDVVDRQARAAGGEDEAHALIVGESPESCADSPALVGHDLEGHLQPRALAEGRERGAGDVLALAAGERGGDGQHGRPHAEVRRQSCRPPDFSTRAISAISTPRSRPLTMS